MKFGVGILDRKLSSDREFGDYKRWGGHSGVMTCTVIPFHILELKSPTQGDEVRH